ncbi:hypothetical protein SAMN06295937_10824 [Sphingopyxis flava]|uniref:Transcriptional regulator TetR C-terminal Proteobacteria type domain-containing protein n=2 Tax=Sphingopyxis flava TaxID=1507287 RepID=A0A1T5GJY0_9SPHN|nr:hypothetical protein SAMN06295937_10824 [Sphingopyxis flava]
MWRTVIESRAESPQIDLAMNNGLKRTLAPMIDYFERAGEVGILAIEDAEAGARVFAELASGGLAAFMCSPASPDEQAVTLRFALDIFLLGASPRQPAPHHK